MKGGGKKSVIRKKFFLLANAFFVLERVKIIINLNCLNYAIFFEFFCGSIKQLKSKIEKT